MAIVGNALLDQHNADDVVYQLAYGTDDTAAAALAEWLNALLAPL